MGEKEEGSFSGILKGGFLAAVMTSRKKRKLFARDLDIFFLLVNWTRSAAAETTQPFCLDKGKRGRHTFFSHPIIPTSQIKVSTSTKDLLFSDRFLIPWKEKTSKSLMKKLSEQVATWSIRIRSKDLWCNDMENTMKCKRERERMITVWHHNKCNLWIHTNEWIRI